MKRRGIASAATASTAHGNSLEWTCSLPPSCDLQPRAFADLKAFEEHYALQHAHVCAIPSLTSRKGEEEVCGKTFPTDWLLECHIAACHSELELERQARGLPHLHCLQPGCDSRFHLAAERSMHAIQIHGFPVNYFFDIVEHGIGDLLLKYGPGASLIVPGGGRSQRASFHPENLGSTPTVPGQDVGTGHTVRHKRSRTDSSDEELPTDVEANGRTMGGHETPIPQARPAFKTPITREEAEAGTALDPAHTLAGKMDALSLVPTAVRRRQLKT
ncbi:hypothetical protein OC842_006907 [Tilletia horrida]|uniref:C2H2-type domain-containing protein n=1 Tax=Tilletia horrida TaxID=155126 RepID=A0AAN6JHH8_9BASI|nr:hypothetical protein OC842_006907 [Tilletia horrida]